VTDPTPRLSVLLASEAPVGVVFRRGPSKVVRLVMWDRRTDRFRPGQSFKGRIYVDRSNISPDGRHLIYFAMAGVAWAVPETGGTWTAISELPSLKATALWGQGDTWFGGGMFLSNRSYWLNADGNTFLIRDNSGLRRETYRPHLTFSSRYERDGWTTAGKNLRGGWVLRGRRKGYELEQPGESTLAFPTWEWADWDRNRLVWAERGCLLAARLGSHKLGPVRTLHDFNDMPAAE
jgi:hypothetical protein